MTKIALEEITEPAPAKTELRSFMQTASKAAVELAPVITREIEARQLDSGQALVAILLYAANFARKAGGRAQDFMASAEQAFADSEELFATGVVEVLQAARKLLARGWCQGEMALKWVRDTTLPEGKRLANCHVDDKYASRWSLLGAIEASADAKSNRERARSAVVLAIRDAGFQFKPGSLDITVINDYNDVGWAPPLPKLTLPEPPLEAVWAQETELPDGSKITVKQNYDATVAKMKHDYETITVPQWPKQKVPGRTKDEVLAVLDRAIVILGS